MSSATARGAPARLHHVSATTRPMTWPMCSTVSMAKMGSSWAKAARTGSPGMSAPARRRARRAWPARRWRPRPSERPCATGEQDGGRVQRAAHLGDVVDVGGGAGHLGAGAFVRAASCRRRCRACGLHGVGAFMPGPRHRVSIEVDWSGPGSPARSGAAGCPAPLPVGGLARMSEMGWNSAAAPAAASIRWRCPGLPSRAASVWRARAGVAATPPAPMDAPDAPAFDVQVDGQADGRDVVVEALGNLVDPQLLLPARGSGTLIQASTSSGRHHVLAVAGVQRLPAAARGARPGAGSSAPRWRPARSARASSRRWASRWPRCRPACPSCAPAGRQNGVAKALQLRAVLATSAAKASVSVTAAPMAMWCG
jgi:hypothetical protein